jgi:disulfide bond formation protein DsbB
MLAAAHAFETFGHMPPCHLCLKQREVYWLVVGLSVLLLAFEAAAALLKRRPMAARAEPLFVMMRSGVAPLVRRAPHPANLILALVFLFGAGLAAYHAGVEWKWWLGPATCTSGGAGRVTAADLGALMKGVGGSAPMCDKAAWVFLGLSMAGWNALISLGLAGISLVAALRQDPRP